MRIKKGKTGLDGMALPKVRNTKPEWAKPDDPIYTTGFVIGGRSLKETKQPEEAQEDNKEDSDD